MVDHYLPADRLSLYFMSIKKYLLCEDFKDGDFVVTKRLNAGCKTCKNKKYDFSGSLYLLNKEDYKKLLENDK